MSNLADLNIVTQPDTDKNYFNFKATNLKIDKNYAIKFQWIYSDGTVSDWSPGKFVVTNTESVPGAPSVTVPSTNASYIPVTLSSFPVNAKRVDVYIIGGSYGTGKVADSFFQAGTKSISVGAGTYQVSLITVSPSGINGTPSNTFTITVTDPTANIQVETPTLASGLTVNSAPFAVSVNWPGTYSSSDFDGFKSIDIHVRDSDVGATATAGFSSTTQVATLTVTGTTNRQNIGLDNLRQALSLASNTLAYTSPMFFYYITRNSQDALYSVSGTPTYTRINSSTVNPTKAVITDLSSGTISIENLVAGSGNFSSYLRVGSSSTSGGGRIELSGVNNFTDSATTRVVKRGITAYDSGNNEVLSFDYGAVTPTLAIKGTLTGSTGVFGPVTINTSGIFSTNFNIASDGSASFNGIITASGGTIGGWTINPTQIRSSGTNYISLDPITPRISLVNPTLGTITIDPVQGIKDSTGNFTLTPGGNLTLRGSITTGSTITGSTITGSTINLTGVQTGSGSGASYTEFSDTSYKLNFTDARYTIIPANDTWTETISIPSYDPVNDEWNSTTTSSTITSNTIKFTDSVFKGSIPSSTYYYGETWYEGGNSGGSIINYVNYSGGYLGFEIRANTSEKGFYFIGDSNISGQNWGVAHYTTSFKDQPAMLQTDSTGKVTRGRAIFTTGSSSTTILGSTWTSVGQNGDLAFSTNN